MALINCSMNKSTVLVTSGTSNVTSVELEITPDAGFVVAARDFLAGANPDAAKIQSITLSDSITTGGPQNDGSYTASNKVKVTVDFVNGFSFTESIKLDINPSGAATATHAIPIKLQGTLVVPDPLDKTTFTTSSLLDFASSSSTTDFYAYDNPGDLVTVVVMTIAATSGDFISEDPTAVVTNASDETAAEDYTIDRIDTLDSSNRLTQVVYTIKSTLPSSSRSGDVITFTGSGADIPGLDKKVYGYRMNTGEAGLTAITRRLEVYGDQGAQFRIKMQRGTLSGSTYTTDTSNGIYVFDNSRDSITTIFEPASSTTTYPSEIDQTDGSYDPATDPLTLGVDGLFFKDIFIPNDVAEKVYRFTIVPESGTTVDLTAPGIDTTADPDTITFDITRKGYANLISTHSTARSGVTNTVEYFDNRGDSKGVTTPRGRKNYTPNAPANNYSYELVFTDNVDFHLPNQANYFRLSELNYTNTFNGADVAIPTVSAELKANSDGFNTGSIEAVGYSSHTQAEAHEANVQITLTESQREALTNKTSLNIGSFGSSITVDGDFEYFKINFFTVDDTPIYKSQTLKVFANFDVEGDDDGQQNTTTIAAPAVDRSKLYMKGSNLTVAKWGDGNASISHDLDTFAFTSAQSINTLNISFPILHSVIKHINSIGKNASYTQDSGFSVSQLVATDGGTVYTKQNLTKATGQLHVKFTVTGAFIVPIDGLPVGYNVNGYDTYFVLNNEDPAFANATASFASVPTPTLYNASNVDRKLELSSFSIVIDFSNALSALSTSTSYILDFKIIHRLNNSYEDITTVEDNIINLGTSSGLAPY